MTRSIAILDKNLLNKKLPASENYHFCGATDNASEFKSGECRFYYFRYPKLLYKLDYE